MTTNLRRLANLAQRLISGAALTVIALAVSDALFDDLVLTTTGLVVAVVVLLLPGEMLVDPLLGWLARRDRENPGLTGCAYLLVVAVWVLEPFWLLPIAAAISPGLDFDGIAAYVGTAFILMVSGVLAWVLLYRRTVRLDEST